MAVETEIKIRVADVGHVRTRLRRLGARLDVTREFEDNFVLDFPGGCLRSERSLLRVRTTARGDTVTYKGPPRPDGPFKQREEIEFGVSSAAESLEVFERLGLTVWFRYQKFREEYTLETDGETVHLTIDETPIGHFVEVEGSEGAIRRVAAELGHEQREFLRDSYYTLYVEECRRKGSEPRQMVFSSGDPSGHGAESKG